MSLAAPVLGLALLLCAGLLWLRSARLQARSGLPALRPVYQDLSDGRPPERPLVSHRYGLVGRPDLLIRREGSLIPVEAKPRRRAAQPYRGDLLQLAAYCLLVEETQGHPPPYGLLRYAETTWRVPWDEASYEALIEALEAIDAAWESGGADRDHERPGRCRACSFREPCQQGLA